jgi:hypothetical protein
LLTEANSDKCQDDPDTVSLIWIETNRTDYVVREEFKAYECVPGALEAPDDEV